MDDDDEEEDKNGTGSANATDISNPRSDESVNPPGYINSNHNYLFSSDEDDKVEVVEVEIGIVDKDARGHSS